MEGLDSGTVVGISFAAFIIGVLLTAALWVIHTHTGRLGMQSFFVSFVSKWFMFVILQGCQWKSDLNFLARFQGFIGLAQNVMPH